MADYINIDTDDNTDQVVRVTLDGTLYWFRLRYTDRSNWNLSIYDYDLYDTSISDNSSALLYGERRLMPAYNFLEYTHEKDTLPKGFLYLYDTETPDILDYEFPTQYNLGTGKRFVLVYLSEDEI